MFRAMLIVLISLIASPVFSATDQEYPAGFQLTEEVLIPAGEFQMGKIDGKDGLEQHQVCIESFFMDKHEVTNGQYQAFCEATERKLPVFWGLERFRSGSDFPDHPVVGVSNSDAKEYASWCGRRLPTEAEYSKAPISIV